MEVPDTRGAGGRAPRGRGTGTTPGKLLGIVTSPLQMISKTVQGLVRKTPNDDAQSGAAAPVSLQPSQPSRRPVQIVTADVTKSQIDSVNISFSFPTLAQKESPPANALLRPALSPQHRPAATEEPPPSVSRQTTTCKDMTSGWSPAKLESLNFFLRGVLPPPAVEVPMPSVAPGSCPQQAIISVRPYQGLQSVAGSLPEGEGDGFGSQLLAGSSGAPTRVVGFRTGAGARFNPYGRPNTSKPPRPGGAVGGPRPQLPAPQASAQPTGTLALPAAQAPLSLAVASAMLPPPHPHPSGQPPRPPTAPGGVRLAPGQVAFGSGRTGTPMPKFGSVAAGTQHNAVTPPGGFRPLLGAVGGKRQRDATPAASPLMASGIRDLSEFKRRRQALSQQPRSILANLSARTPRENTPVRGDVDRTPGGVGSAGSGGSTGMATPGMTPAPALGGTQTGETPTTETARKILETLDNFARATDQTVNANGISVKGPLSLPRQGGLGGTPIQGFLPPLDRLDQNQCGRSPSLTPTLGTGATGFVSPAPPGLTVHAGHTPGPRMALDFQSPAPSLGPQALQGPADNFTTASTVVAPLGSPLPLSPIAIPNAQASERHATEQGEDDASKVRFDAPVAGDQKRTVGFALDVSSTSTENKFTFSDPAAPSDPRLRNANQAVLADTNVAKSSLGAPAFSFTSPSVGVGSSASQAREGLAVASTAPPATPKTPAVSVIEEVAKAAATPLPDDDDDDSPGGSETAEPPVEARVSAPAADKRVSFAETGKEQADKQATKAKEAASLPASTPPSTPSSFFFSNNAGSTPFRPVDGTQPLTPLETASALGSQAGGSGSQSIIFSFSSATPAAAETHLSEKPSVAPAPPSTSNSIFENQPESQAARAETSGTDRPAAEASKPAAPSGFTFGVPITFGVKDSQLATAASASIPAPESSVAKTADAPTTAPEGGFGFSFGAAPPARAINEPSTGFTSQPFTFGSGAPAAAVAPASTTPSASGPAPSTTATGSMFTFGSVSTSAPSNPSATASASAPSFTFGAASSAPPPSFGSPLPSSISAASSAPQDAQPSGGAGGFGSTASGGFGAASGAPSTTFSFGAQPSSGSGGGAQTGCSGGFGSQSGGANPSVPFSFGAGASAPAFGAGSTAPAFGATAPSSQPSFGSAAPTFGVSAPAPANPFGAAAPTFGSGTFGAAAGSSGPAFGTTAAAPSFGGGAIGAFGSGAASGPTFGSGAVPAPSFGGNTAPTPSFGGFGNPPNNSTQSPGMFSFGGGAPAAFNGTAAPVAAPAFGGPAPNFGMQAQPQPQASAPVPSFGATPGGFGGFGGQPSFGAAPPPSPGGDAGGGFSLGHGDPKDGRKRVKARRHGH